MRRPSVSISESVRPVLGLVESGEREGQGNGGDGVWVWVCDAVGAGLALVAVSHARGGGQPTSPCDGPCLARFFNSSHGWVATGACTEWRMYCTYVPY